MIFTRVGCNLVVPYCRWPNLHVWCRESSSDLNGSTNPDQTGHHVDQNLVCSQFLVNITLISRLDLW